MIHTLLFENPFGERVNASFRFVPLAMTNIKLILLKYLLSRIIPHPPRRNINLSINGYILSLVLLNPQLQLRIYQ